MKLRTLGLMTTCLAMAIAPVQGASAAARDSDKILSLTLESARSHPDYAAKAPTDIKFYFDGQPVTVKQLLGPVKTSRKTNGSGKRNKPDACRWALISGLIALAEEARLQGGNAVVNIKSNFGDVESSSPDSYKCGVGSIMVGVALKGDVAVVE
ncbi:MAG: hypothetical protein Q7T61_11585 [Caulobacter sp.]|nr:hypothetical protein [Caulobacter sp.]